MVYEVIFGSLIIICCMWKFQ